MGKFNSLPEAICHVKCILLWKQKKTREWGVYNYLLQEPKGCPNYFYYNFKKYKGNSISNCSREV